MTQPNVFLTELDGALGILPATAGKLFAITGPSSSGPLNTPATFARISDVQTAFGAGPLVEAAAYYIERYGKPVLLVRTAASSAGAVSAIDNHSAVGTSVVTVHTGAVPVDNHEIALLITANGTVGTAGATYKTSADGGRTWSPVAALGTANSIVLPGEGITLDLGTGTLKAGDLYTATATTAKWTTGELGDALDALKNTLAAWEFVLVLGDIDSSAFDAVETKVAGMNAAGKYHWWFGNVRIPTAGESEATYLTAMTALSAAKSTKYGTLSAGGCKLTSSINGRKYRRPFSWPTAARAASVRQHINGADINLGPLAGVSIRDDNGNPDEHDETVNPGLDDLRYLTARTWDGYPGVYINRERTFASAGSDFQLVTYRRVMNVGLEALRNYLTIRLNQPLIVSRATGFLVASEATEIQLGAEAVLRAALLSEPMASDISFKLSRTDNVLSTKTITGEARIVPLAYPEAFAVTVGFINPAMQLQAA